MQSNKRGGRDYFLINCKRSKALESIKNTTWAGRKKLFQQKGGPHVTRENPHPYPPGACPKDALPGKPNGSWKAKWKAKWVKSCNIRFILIKGVRVD